MKTLDKEQGKIAKICAALRQETLEPAEKRAKEIIEEATRKAEEMIFQSEKEAGIILEKAKLAVQHEKALLQSSVKQAIEQALEHLRQEIENNLFHRELANLVQKSSSTPKSVASIIEALIKAVEKHGLVKELIAHIPASISPQEVTAELTEQALSKLKDQTVTVGNFKGGAHLKLTDKKMTIDMSDAALKELLSTFIRKDLRALVFGQK